MHFKGYSLNRSCHHLNTPQVVTHILEAYKIYKPVNVHHMPYPASDQKEVGMSNPGYILCMLCTC